MSFLDADADLTDTIFTAEHLQIAREHLSAVINYYVPGWSEFPQGPLATYWMSNNTNDVCFLIDLSRIIATLESKVTQKSLYSLSLKVKDDLFYAKSKMQLSDTLTEMQFASGFTEYVSPIAIDPFVPESKINASNRPATTDFAVRLPDNDIAIEVTVFNVDLLSRWDNAVSQLESRISSRLRKSGGRRSIEFHFPINFGKYTIPKHVLLDMLYQIVGKESSSYKLNVQGQEGLIIWKPLPHYTVSSNLDPDKMLSEVAKIMDSLPLTDRFATFSSGGVVTGASVGFDKYLTKEDASKVFAKSLENKLKSKRTQFIGDIPYLLSVTMGDHRLFPPHIINLVINNIWPHPDHKWISGIIVFTPRTGFSERDRGASYDLYLNPNASHPPGESLSLIFAGKKTFHLHAKSSRQDAAS